MKNILWFLALFAGFSVHAAVRNDWTFETEFAGVSLAGCSNSGADRVSFSGIDSVTKTDGSGGLGCSNAVSGVGSFWTNGTVLTADVTDQNSGTHFLRYDLDYDLTSADGDSGTLLALSFSDGTGTNLVGAYLKKGVTSSDFDLLNVRTTNVAIVGYSGNLAVIAKVDLDNRELSVWYNFGGDIVAAYDSPNKIVTNLNLSTIKDFQFRATGDLIPTATGNAAVFKNIRTADTWEEILFPLVDHSRGAMLTISSVTDTKNWVMADGDTNTITVVVQNFYSAATNVYTALTYTGGIPGSLVVITNEPPAASLDPNHFITNTFQVIGNAAPFDYEFFITAKSDKTNSITIQTNFIVGAAVQYQGNVISSNASPGIYQPGDRLTVEVISKAFGKYAFSNTVNALTAKSSGFTITPPSDTYLSLDPGATTSTVYQVEIGAEVVPGTYTFTVNNSSGGTVWSDQFTMNVSYPSVDDQALEIIVPKGGIKSGSVALTNKSILPLSFSIRDDGSGAAGDYMLTTQLVDRALFMGSQFEPKTVLTNWSGSVTESMDLKFDAHVFGGTYTRFSVSPYGKVILSNASGTTAQLIPYTTSSALATNWIRYRSSSTNLVVAWGVDPKSSSFDGGMFQVWLNADGTIRYLYKYGMNTGGGIKVRHDTRIQSIFHSPGIFDHDSLLLTPTFWVSHDASAGRTIAGGGTQNITFTADAANEPIGTNSFIATVDWSSGQSSLIDVTVKVEDPSPFLAIPNPFAFNGSVFTTTNMIITNTGNVDLTYVISDSNLENAGYVSNSVSYRWIDIPRATPYILNEADLGVRTIGIGFPFTFLGKTRTSLVVNENGSLRFVDGAYIDLGIETDFSYIPGQSRVLAFADFANRTLTVSWEEMSSPESNDGQFFQVVLSSDGTIRANYNFVDIDASEIQAIYERYTTNSFGIVSINKSSILLTPGADQVIRASPAVGTVVAGGTAQIALCGDAREAGAGVYITTLNFNYSELTATSVVAFTANTNPIDVGEIWGGEAAFSMRKNADGTYLLAWPVPSDWQKRIYTVWYTDSLSKDWQSIVTLTNRFSYVDENPDRNALPAIFYRITVQ
jgi:hypothetical protein